MENTTVELNRSLLEKTVDEFYVKFLNFENNRENILGRSVYSFERPSITFNVFETKFQGERRVDNAQIIFQPFNIVFRDDDKNLVMKVLYEQLYRQIGTVNPIRDNKTFDKTKFDLGVGIYNTQKIAIETFTVKGCFITGINHSEYIMTAADPNRITVSIQCDTVSYDFVNDYIIGSTTADQTNELP